MTTTTIQRADQYEARARAALAAGFQNETRRKEEGTDMVSRAYSELRDIVQSATWEAIRGQGSDAEARSWELGLPYDLHNMRTKHTDYALEVAPATADTITRIQGLLALRNEIKAAALLPRKTPKREQVPQEGDKTQQRGNCQCCGRDHAVNGTVAKHGYTVEMRGMGGFFKGGCRGHRFVPMQVSREQTDRIAADLRAQAVVLNRWADNYESGKTTPTEATVGYGRNKKTIAWADASKVEQHEELQRLICSNRNEARGYLSFADQLQALATNVHGQPLRTVKV